MIEDLAKSKKPPSSYTCFTCGAENKMKWKSTHSDNVKLLKCLGCHNVWDKGEGKYQCDACLATYCCRCVFRDMAENGDYGDEETQSEDESESESDEEDVYRPSVSDQRALRNHNHNYNHSGNGKGTSNRGHNRKCNTLSMYGFRSAPKQSQSSLPALEKDSSPDKDHNVNMRKNRKAIVISDDESDQERTELQEDEEKLEVEDKMTDTETPKGDEDQSDDENVIDNASTDTNDTVDSDHDTDDDIDTDSDEYEYEYEDDDVDFESSHSNTKIKAAESILNMIQFLFLAWESGPKRSSLDEY